MTTVYDPAVSTALIDWVIFPTQTFLLESKLTREQVNSFNLPPKTNKVKTLSELYDGRTISLILNDIDPKYFGDGVVKRPSNSSASVNWVQHFNVCTFSPQIPTRQTHTVGQLLVGTKVDCNSEEITAVYDGLLY